MVFHWLLANLSPGAFEARIVMSFSLILGFHLVFLDTFFWSNQRYCTAALVHKMGQAGGDRD